MRVSFINTFLLPTCGDSGDTCRIADRQRAKPKQRRDPLDGHSGNGDRRPAGLALDNFAGPIGRLIKRNGQDILRVRGWKNRSESCDYPIPVIAALGAIFVGGPGLAADLVARDICSPAGATAHNLADHPHHRARGFGRKDPLARLRSAFDQCRAHAGATARQGRECSRQMHRRGR